MVVTAFRKVGLACALPKASLYVWAAIPAGWTSVNFTDMVLKKARVSLTPGPVFGKGGEGYVRLSFTQSTERIEEAMRRLVLALGG